MKSVHSPVWSPSSLPSTLGIKPILLTVTHMIWLLSNSLSSSFVTFSLSSLLIPLQSHQPSQCSKKCQIDSLFRVLVFAVCPAFNPQIFAWLFLNSFRSPPKCHLRKDPWPSRLIIQMQHSHKDSLTNHPGLLSHLLSNLLKFYLFTWLLFASPLECMYAMWG